MGDTKDNFKTESVNKLKKLAEDVGVCMFCTKLDRQPIPARPMSVQEVDEHGNLWFLSHAKSHKNFEIAQDDKVQLFFSKMSNSHYLSVYGTASIFTNKSLVDEHWTPMAKPWFQEGKDDPDVTVIKVTPSDAYYWDTKDGQAVMLFKMAVRAMGADVDDGGVQGDIKL